jgi:hypothetical protein
MANLNTSEAQMRAQNSPSPAANSTQQTSSADRPVVTPAQWARQVLGIKEPFGFDRQPTVWG